MTKHALFVWKYQIYVQWIMEKYYTENKRLLWLGHLLCGTNQRQNSSLGWDVNAFLVYRECWQTRTSLQIINGPIDWKLGCERITEVYTYIKSEIFATNDHIQLAIAYYKLLWTSCILLDKKGRGKILHGKQKIIVIGPLVVWDESKTKLVIRMGCKCVPRV
jgi:hypothetical protein